MKKLKKQIKELKKIVASQEDSLRNLDFQLRNFKEDAILEFTKYAEIIKELRSKISKD